MTVRIEKFKLNTDTNAHVITYLLQKVIQNMMRVRDIRRKRLGELRQATDPELPDK